MNLWICPICNERLNAVEGEWRCENGHSFDAAREGYVNLLVGRQKSGSKGDTREMLEARRRWFAEGFYEPLRTRLIDLVGDADLSGRRPIVVAEAGCGEGYYIGGVSEAWPRAVCLGYDIAKDGARLAARRYPRVQFAVADTNKGLPWSAGVVDVLLDVFAPRNAAEFARVARPGGRLIVVVPTERHLAELRAVRPLLAIQPEKRQLVEAAMAADFKLESAELLTVPMRPDAARIADLIGMTPNAWFTPRVGSVKLEQISQLAVTAEFQILVFVKNETREKA